MTSLPLIAEDMARALRSYPCTCISVGSWPLFNAEATSKHKPKTCMRCRSLVAYDRLQMEKADRAIVQRPGRPQCNHEAFAKVDGKCGGCGGELA